MTVTLDPSVSTPLPPLEFPEEVELGIGRKTQQLLNIFDKVI